MTKREEIEQLRQEVQALRNEVALLRQQIPFPVTIPSVWTIPFSPPAPFTVTASSPLEPGDYVLVP